MWIDIFMLTIWGIIMDVIAYVITGWIASSSLELPVTESVFIAPSFVIIFLVYHRWGNKGLVTNGVFLLLHLILYHSQIFVSYQYPLMIIGAYAVFSLTLLLKRFAKKPQFKNWFSHMIGFTAIYVLMFITEWLIGNILGLDVSLLGVMLRHTTNLIISVLVIVIMALQKHLIVDMKEHLIQQSKQKEEDYA